MALFCMLQLTTREQGLLKCRKKGNGKFPIGTSILPQRCQSSLQQCVEQARGGAAGHAGLLRGENGGKDTTSWALQLRQHWLRSSGITEALRCRKTKLTVLFSVKTGNRKP